ncbi:hypothetical protein MHLP_04025 [Candidatus Mycoplasma haematolamae str. Purdue]|uniref:Uncharacterized protein n=1 Tax=Mycoplasma haematolamae (strain Purdue) TaxID=1212765 RepID=I7BAN5_MYCHA|nr:hypothetical protein [Candidatus Mycoplasma haematolamae]AFO52385.1 hypothetical protein MHLP_04025 [Candidatus Mycoplasma haematolamae str. Purdue]
MTVTKTAKTVIGFLTSLLGLGGTTVGIVEAAMPDTITPPSAVIPKRKLLVGKEIPDWWKRGNAATPPKRGYYDGVRDSADWKCMLNPNNKEEEKCIHGKVYKVAKDLKLTDRQAFKFDAWNKKQFDSRQGR